MGKKRRRIGRGGRATKGKMAIYRVERSFVISNFFFFWFFKFDFNYLYMYTIIVGTLAL